jgi:N-methylhydantoinase A
MIAVGVDTGGTFTDFIFRDGDRWRVHKVLSTPSNPAEAVLKGLNHLARGKTKQIVHGSTVATNAILERKGARTALITNKGFEDIIEIGRQSRSRLYDLGYRREPHLVGSDLRFGIKGRVLNTGEEHESLDLEEAQKVVSRFEGLQTESVAVCFLFSFANPSHEQKMRKLLEPAGLHVSLSHQILAEFREFERTSSTVLNAYVAPKMKHYIGYLMAELEERDILSVMQSNGGSISADTAMEEPVRTILSGPAGGAVGAFELGKIAGHEQLITFDMGGTSTDVCLMDRHLSITVEANISSYPIKVPMIDMNTVGAGGGSIATLDEGGALKVGPESAGADPGPICYGKGDELTVTDANLYLGRLIPEYFLGGGMKLQAERLDSYFEKMANEAGLTPVELAEGILSVTNTAMEKAIRVISVERGYDPREFILFTFGGAGGMHAPFLARLLSIPTVLVPENPGILSALGMLMADVIKDYSLTVMRDQFNVTPDELSELFVGLEERGRDDLRAEGIPAERVRHERFLDMRYEGQSYEIMVPFGSDYIKSFHQLHEKTYGYRNQNKIVEVVNIRLRARGMAEKPRWQEAVRGTEKLSAEAMLGEREVVFDQFPTRTPVIAREKLRSGNRIRGPAVVVEYTSTIVIPPFAHGLVDEYGNIVLNIE